MTEGAQTDGDGQYRTVEFEVRDHVATITLDRPDRMNSFDRTMCEEIAHLWEISLTLQLPGKTKTSWFPQMANTVSDRRVNYPYSSRMYVWRSRTRSRCTQQTTY